MGTDISRRGLLASSGALAATGLLVQPQAAHAEPPAAPAGGLPDEDGYDLWLRYRRVQEPGLLAAYRRAITHLVHPGEGEVLAAASGELRTALRGLLGRETPIKDKPSGPGAVIFGTRASSPQVAAAIKASELAGLGAEGYVLRSKGNAILVAGQSERGVLYGAFHLLRLIQTQRSLSKLNVTERPANPLRLANHWDNLNRTVERGYAGSSVFHWEELPETRPRYSDYARALASIGMNGAAVNNVNASPEFLSSAMIQDLAALAAKFRPWGVALYLSANFAAPMLLDGLTTADPLDEGVRAWWRGKADEIYAAIPDFGGLLVKANSEGQPGPIDYGRTHADGANLIAEAVAPHGGIVMWRAFVHNFDSNTWAHQAYETFKPLDGQFAENAVLQIKNGPIDFQVREPIHPLFGALPKTNSMIELQVTQEYTGQSTHLCYLVPLWKEIYDFDTHAKGAGTTVADVVGGQTYGYSHSGVAGVMNFGDDTNWTRHHLAAANTHGYGRLAWNPKLSAASLADEWIRMTFGPGDRVLRTLKSMLLSSREIFEDYTSPLGCGFMQLPDNHLDPDPIASQSFHRSDAGGTGYDRTAATGNGYPLLYNSPTRETYESLATCPEELLLFLHHVPYSHVLSSGKTVIQHIYDTHFDGVEDARRLRDLWRTLRNHVDDRRYAETLERFGLQIDNAVLWRDVLAGFFFEIGKVLDSKRSWVQLKLASSSSVVLAGAPSAIDVVVGNASASQQDVTIQLAPTDGWTSGTGTVSLASLEFGSLQLPVTVADQAPGFAQPRVSVDAGGVTVLGGWPAGRGVNVVVVPSGDRCVLALDAGTATSPLLDSYLRLSPTDDWAAAKGYGWVGGRPQSRDRGSRLDPLRRDFVNDTTARTFRVAVPAGAHEAFILVGDIHQSHPTFVRSGGQVLAESQFLENGSFTWLRFPLDGGATGREVDLELSSVPGQHWHLGAFVLRAAR